MDDFELVTSFIIINFFLMALNIIIFVVSIILLTYSIDLINKIKTIYKDYDDVSKISDL